MKLAALVAACALGCGSPPAATTPATTPTKPKEPITSSCTPYVYKELVLGGVPGGAGGPAAYTIAENGASDAMESAATASAKHDYRNAARLFLACATAFRGVPDTDLQKDMAAINGLTCYENMQLAFANAGAGADGKAALDTAAKEDPRLAAEIKKLLDKMPTDCTP